MRKFETPLRHRKEKEGDGSKSDRSEINLPKISKTNVTEDKKPSNRAIEASEYRLIQYVNELEENVKERFAEHNKKFDAESDVIVSKSLCDLNVALLGEYFLPKLQVIINFLSI